MCAHACAPCQPVHESRAPSAPLPDTCRPAALAVAKEPAPRATTALGVPVGGHRPPICERCREGRPGLPGSPGRSFAHSQLCTHSLVTGTRVCLLTHSYLHMLIHATSTHALKCTHGLAQLFTLTHVHTLIDTCACSRSFLHVCSPSHTPACTPTHSETRTDSHMYSHTPSRVLGLGLTLQG